MSTQTKPKKSPSLRKLRRDFLKAQLPTVPVPLNDQEYVKLEGLISQAADSNVDLFNAARSVGDLRLQLDSAEGELRVRQAHNSKIHAELAPLLHRLPTV